MSETARLYRYPTSPSARRAMGKAGLMHAHCLGGQDVAKRIRSVHAGKRRVKVANFQVVAAATVACQRQDPCRRQVRRAAEILAGQAGGLPTLVG